MEESYWIKLEQLRQESIFPICNSEKWASLQYEGFLGFEKIYTEQEKCLVRYFPFLEKERMSNCSFGIAR
jgi:hypothetical protein